jgi:hypothetical protein
LPEGCIPDKTRNLILLKQRSNLNPKSNNHTRIPKNPPKVNQEPASTASV